MHKQNIFANTITAVSTATDLPVEVILSKCRSEEAVDARYILFHLLSVNGLYPSQIASLTGHTRRCVNKILSQFSSRKESRRIMGINLEHAAHILGTTREQEH